MALNPEFGRLLRDAKRAWERRHDRDLSNQELADLIAAEAGAGSLSGQAVGAWLNKGQEPSSLALLRATATVLETTVEALVPGAAGRPASGGGVQPGAAGTPVSSASLAAKKRAGAKKTS